MKVERRVPGEELHPGRIPKFHIRYSPVFGLQNWGDRKLQRHFRMSKNGAFVDRVAVSDMGEVVVVLKEKEDAKRQSPPPHNT